MMLRYAQLIFILAIFFATSLQAQQDRNVAKLGYEYLSISTQDGSGHGVYLEYARIFQEPVWIVLQGSYAVDASPSPSIAENVYTTWSGNMALGYVPVSNDYQQLRIDGGVAMRFFDEGWNVDEVMGIPPAVTKVGLLLGVNYDFTPWDHWQIGARAQAQFFGSGIAVDGIGGHVGYRF